MRPQVNKSAHQSIDQESEENVFPLQVVPCLRCLKPPSSLLCAFGAACTETLVTTIKGFNASTPGNDGHPLSIQMIGNASTVALPYYRGLEHFVVFLVLFRTALASLGNKTFETVANYSMSSTHTLFDVMALCIRGTMPLSIGVKTST